MRQQSIADVNNVWLLQGLLMDFFKLTSKLTANCLSASLLQDTAFVLQTDALCSLPRLPCCHTSEIL